MRLALLGNPDDGDPAGDPENRSAEIRALAEAAVAAGHVISWREDAPADGPEEWARWEDLVDPSTADAILVGPGGDADLRARQVGELVKLGRPLLTVHPLAPSVISFFEIDMARGESGAVLMHYNPLLEFDALADASDWVRTGHPQLGAVEQVVATRLLGERTPERVLWHFSRDVELLAHLAGRLDRIGAHAAMAESEAAYSSLSVQLLGALPVAVRWAVEPAAGASVLRVTLVCARGRVTLAFDEGGRCSEVIEQGAGPAVSTPVEDVSPAAAMVDRFTAAVAAGEGSASTWQGALDAMELTDSIEISLRRGRMVDIHHRELTEDLAFKGVMSALSCGVLVVLVPAMLAVGWLAGLLRIPLSEYWPHLLLALLAAFLGLQFLPALVGRRTTAGMPTDRSSGPDAGVDSVD